MKKLIMLITVIIISFLGCEKKSDNIDNYLGEVLTLNNEPPCIFDVIVIKQTPLGGLPAGTRITFNSNDLEEDLEIGDIVRFRINYHVEWTGPATAICLWPHYSASIELISN